MVGGANCYFYVLIISNIVPSKNVLFYLVAWPCLYSCQVIIEI